MKIRRRLILVREGNRDGLAIGAIVGARGYQVNFAVELDRDRDDLFSLFELRPMIRFISWPLEDDELEALER